MNVAYRIMACEERKDFVEAEIKKLAGCDVKVFYDDREDRSKPMTSYTQMKCINDVLNGEKSYTHICLLQDDILLVDRFDECIEKLIMHRPFDLWTLFCPRIKDVDFQQPYTQIKPPNTWGQGNLIPTTMLRKIVDFRNEFLPNYIYDDGLYLMYLGEIGKCSYTTNVALMQHLCPTESTLGYNNKNKVSKVWAGEDVYDRINWRCADEKRINTGKGCDYEKEYKRWGNSNS